MAVVVGVLVDFNQITTKEAMTTITITLRWKWRMALVWVEEVVVEEKENRRKRKKGAAAAAIGGVAAAVVTEAVAVAAAEVEVTVIEKERDPEIGKNRDPGTGRREADPVIGPKEERKARTESLINRKKSKFAFSGFLYLFYRLMELDMGSVPV